MLPDKELYVFEDIVLVREVDPVGVTVSILFLKIGSSGMAPVPLLVFFALFNPLLVCASKDGLAFNRRLPFNCGKLGEIGFPFTNNTSPETCGPCVVDGCDEKSQRIQLVRGGKWFELHSISRAGTISITDKDLRGHLNSNSCDSFNNLSLPASLPYFSIQEISNLTLFNAIPVSIFLTILNLTIQDATTSASIILATPVYLVLHLPVQFFSSQ